MMLYSHYLTVCRLLWTGAWKELTCSVRFLRCIRWDSRCRLLYKLRAIGVRGQLLSIASEFLSDRRQRVHLDGKVSASVDVVSGVVQSSVLGLLLFILYTSEFTHIVGDHIEGYADDATINAIISRPLARPQVMKSVNKNLASINSE